MRVIDEVGAPATIEGVVSRPSRQEIEAPVSTQDVRTRATEELVELESADQRVVAPTPEHGVLVMVGRGDVVIAATCTDEGRTPSSIDPVVAVAAVQEVESNARVDPIRAIAPSDAVGATSRADEVTGSESFDDVSSAEADYDVLPLGADQCLGALRPHDGGAAIEASLCRSAPGRGKQYEQRR